MLGERVRQGQVEWRHFTQNFPNSRKLRFKKIRWTETGGFCRWVAEKAVAPHSSTLAWKISWTEEPGGLQSMGSLRVRQDSATSLSLFTFMHWRRKWQPTPVFLPGNPRDGGASWATVHGVTQSWTWLKEFSSRSSSRGYQWWGCLIHRTLNVRLKRKLLYIDWTSTAYQTL